MRVGPAEAAEADTMDGVITGSCVNTDPFFLITYLICSIAHNGSQGAVTVYQVRASFAA